MFVLGVTACVLATGSYPEMGTLRRDEHGSWYLDSLMLPRALFSAQVAPPLRELILRMLSIRPEERGTAAELPQALEQAADSLTAPSSPPSASVPERPVGEGTEALASSLPSSPRSPVHSRRRWLAVAAAAAAVVMGAVWVAPATFTWAPEGTQFPRVAENPTGSAGAPDADPVGLGEAAASTATTAPPQSPAFEAMAGDSPPELSPGQAQPDKKGQCLHPRQVILNGGCWVRLQVNREECEVFIGQMYQDACYVPIFPPGSKRPNTSGPKNPR